MQRACSALGVQETALIKYRTWLQQYQNKRISAETNPSLQGLLQFSKEVGIVLSPCAEVRHVQGRGYGVFARCRVPAGHSVVCVPETPQRGTVYTSKPSGLLGSLHHTFQCAAALYGVNRREPGFRKSLTPDILQEISALGGGDHAIGQHLRGVLARMWLLNHATLQVADALMTLPISHPYRAFLHSLPAPSCGAIVPAEQFQTPLAREWASNLQGMKKFRTLPSWAVAHVLSRACSRAGHKTLYPVADLFNHSHDPNCGHELHSGCETDWQCALNAVGGVEESLVDPASGEPILHLIALREIHPDEELTFSYFDEFDSQDEFVKEMFRFQFGFVGGGTEGRKGDSGSNELARRRQEAELHWLASFQTLIVDDEHHTIKAELKK